jgi:hypothetical protein
MLEEVFRNDDAVQEKMLRTRLPYLCVVVSLLLPILFKSLVPSGSPWLSGLAQLQRTRLSNTLQLTLQLRRTNGPHQRIILYTS